MEKLNCWAYFLCSKHYCRFHCMLYMFVNMWYICRIYVYNTYTQWYLINCDIFSILFISLSTFTLFKKAHMIHKHESYSSFQKSITNLFNIYPNYSFYVVCFSICLLYHTFFIKIKIWNQCMPNKSWLWKDCRVINGFSKKHMYDLDWKVSILKINCHVSCSVNIRCYKKRDYQNLKWICALQQLLR